MTLSRIQRRTLLHYRGLQSDQASIFGQIRRNLGVYTYLLVVAVVLVPIGFTVDESFGMILLGILLGYLIRDIRHFIMVNRVWPIMANVLNWQRIEELLNA